LLVAEGGSVEEAMRWAVDRGHRAVVPHHSLLSRTRVETARELGLAVVAWTVNDSQRAAELAGWGVEAIITDAPQLVARSQ
jgi:glycerophosphoryl diester phosphodiesterase